MTTQVAEHAIFRAIRESMNQMGSAGQKVARFVLTNSRDVIHLTVSELAARADVSEATVIRFCQELGYKGYQDFKIQLSQALVTPMKSLDWSIERGDSAKTLLDKISATNIETIRNTTNNISNEQLTAAIGMLRQARRIVLFGCGGSGIVAHDAAHKIMKLGLNVVSHSDAHNAFQAISVLGPEDLLFVISYSGATRDVLHAVSVAREVGMKIMAITRSGRNPLRDLVNVTLSTSSPESLYRNEGISTRIAQLCIIDALFVGLYLSDENRFGGPLQKTRESLTVTKV